MFLADIDVMLEAFKSLIAAGPVATILGVMCWKLWNKLQAAEDRCRDELKAKDAKLEEHNARTLRLAVRVQRSVEILAGIKAETVIELEEEDERRKSKDGD